MSKTVLVRAHNCGDGCVVVDGPQQPVPGPWAYSWMLKPYPQRVIDPDSPALIEAMAGAIYLMTHDADDLAEWMYCATLEGVIPGSSGYHTKARAALKALTEFEEKDHEPTRS